MNCRRFQNRLHEYLDGDLSRRGKAAAEKHLLQCEACRRALRREQVIAQSIFQELERSARHRTLGADIRRRLVKTLSQENFGAAPARETFPRAVRFAWAAPAAALVLALLGVVFFLPPKTGTVHLPPAGSGDSISLQVSYAVPDYVFRREAGVVVDALCYRTNVVTETLWVENQGIPKKQMRL
jgi:anti-sigma factor RsiW